METALDIISDCQGNKNYINEALVGNSVFTTYGNNKIYSINEVIYNKSPETLVFEHQGKNKNLLQYYKERYGVEIKDKRQPLLKSIVKNRTEEVIVMLVPELCRMTGLTDEMRKNF